MAGRSVDDKLMDALFICSEQPNEVLAAIAPDLNQRAAVSIEQKLNILGLQHELSNLFPCQDRLSESIDRRSFLLSHFQQPEVFLRLRPSYEMIVQEKLTKAGIDFKVMSSRVLAISPTSSIEKVVDLDREAVVQDLSSQGVGEYFMQVMEDTNTIASAWDACAASGGKSIMFKDLMPKISLTVSDVRESILINLRKRFDRAGIRADRVLLADLRSKQKLQSTKFPGKKFDLVIADVPCSGSGTWGRTPEQLSFFSCEKITEYAVLQRDILQNLVPYVQKGGFLLYITCSVYQDENEQQVTFLQNTGLQLITKKLIAGYQKKADSMFVAVLSRKQVD